MSVNPFDASSSLLGYIYQVRYSLLAALKKMQEVDDPDLNFVSIEKLDDIAFEINGEPAELLQTKYHGTPANLGDRSPDIWKTFRIWAGFIKSNNNEFSCTNYYLITTETAKVDTLAYYLSINDKLRNTDRAFSLIKDILRESPSKENEKSYDEVSSLSDFQLKLLVNNIYISDKSENIEGIGKSLKRHLVPLFNREFLQASFERLEGIWFGKVIKSLVDNRERISLGDLQLIIEDIREQISHVNLPSDFANTPIEKIEGVRRDLPFVKQILLFTDREPVVRIAVENYYKSYAQVNKWSADGLLKPTEMKTYYEKLKREWEMVCSMCSMKYTLSEENEKKTYAATIYEKCQMDCTIPIRDNFKDHFVARGTYHYLANELEIGWHPDYTNLITPENNES
ncbi:hypothetical protein JEQ00_04830 [Serratia marcescens]|uniref:ABC-three component system protein n=1 Tax=Serratia marcescens TaxID=615 RepID=UPI0010570DB9|nr:ABC-three component system protein [Serratia marcescens]MBI6170314.1 hypothetical protein [Serratia marcescens]